MPNATRTRSDSPTKTCTHDGCTKPLRARGLCITHYNSLVKPDRNAPKPTACTICGAAIARCYSSSRRPVCSVDCRTLLSGGQPGQYQFDWAAYTAWRARQAGAEIIEVFDRETVFARDGWTCYLCGQQCRQDVDGLHPDSATVDHIVPLSRGGNHTLTNAATCCHRCNSSKRDDLIGMARAHAA